MRIDNINQENVEKYEKLFRSDESANINRACFSGLMAFDEEDQAKGAIVWMTQDTEEDGRYEEEITFFAASDRDVSYKLLKEHDEVLLFGEVTRSSLELDPDALNEAEALKEASYTVEKKESRDIVVTLGELARLRQLRKKAPSFISPLVSLSGMEFWNGVTLCLYNNRKGLLTDLDTLNGDFFEQELSCCVKTDRWIEGMFLIRRLPCGSLMPVLLFCKGADSRKNLLYLLRYALNTALEKYAGDTEVILRRHDKGTRELIAYLLPGARGEEILAGVR